MVKSKDDLVITTDVDNAKAKSGFKQLGDQAQTTGKSITKSVLAANLAAEALSRFASGVAGAMADAVANFTNFEDKFSNVVTLLDSNTPTAKIDSLKNGVLNLGIASGQTFDSLNQGLFDIVSSGAAAGSELRVLTAATNLATAGAASVDVSTKALVSTLTSFGDEAGTAEEISVKFFAAQKRGITNIEQLGGEFNKVAGLSKTLGVSFDETLAAATSLTNDGAKPTSEAFTNLRSVMSALVLAQGKLKNESKEVQDALSLENVKAIGLVGALDQFKTATGGSIVELQKMLGSTEAVSAAIALTGEQQKTFNTILGDFQNKAESAKTFQDALATKQATLKTNTEQLARAWEALTIKLVDRFAPAMIVVTDVLTGLLASYDKQKAGITGYQRTLVGFAEEVKKDYASLAVAAKKSIEEQKKVSAEIVQTKKDEATKTEAISKANVANLEKINTEKLDFIKSSNLEFQKVMNELVAIEQKAADDEARIRKASNENRAFAMREAVRIMQDAAKDLSGLDAGSAYSKGANTNYNPEGKGKPGAPDLSIGLRGLEKPKGGEITDAEKKRLAAIQAKLDEEARIKARNISGGDAAGQVGLNVASQITGVGGAISGFQQGGPMGAAAGFVTDILLSNKEFQEALGELSAIIQEAFGPIIHELIPILQSVGRVLSAMSPAIQKLAPGVELLAKWIEFNTDILMKVINSFDGVGKTIEDLTSPLEELSGSMDDLEGAVDDLVSPIKKLTKVIENFDPSGGGGAAGDFFDEAQKFGEDVKSRLGLSTGGIVPGTGSGDIVPAMLEPGELVLPKKFVMDAGLNMPAAKSLQLSGITKAASGASSAGSADQRIIVDVIISPSEMTNFISTKQREQSNLGISRQ